MVEPREKAAKERGELAEGVKTHLVDVYVRNKYNRFTEVNAKQLDKGNDTEEDSITIVSRITKEFYKKNEEFLSNDFIQGTPDLFKGPEILKAELIRDTKSSWDAFSFFRAKAKQLEKNYYCQVMGYMWLTGARTAYIDYCLNNTPIGLIQRELYKESFNHEGNNTPTWIELQILANHIYDRSTFLKTIQERNYLDLDENAQAIINGFVEIPLKERHFSFEVKYDESFIEKLKERIIKCREYIENDLFKKQLIEV